MSPRMVMHDEDFVGENSVERFSPSMTNRKSFPGNSTYDKVSSATVLPVERSLHPVRQPKHTRGGSLLHEPAGSGRSSFCGRKFQGAFFCPPTSSPSSYRGHPRRWPSRVQPGRGGPPRQAIQECTAGAREAIRVPRVVRVMMITMEPEGSGSPTQGGGDGP